MHAFTIKILETLLLAGVLSGLFSSSAKAQNCDCDLTIYCCSQWGYCGNGYDYCGPGCQAGPCETSCEGTGTLTVSDIVTQEFLDGITSQASADCAGNGFYSRSAFLEAASSFPDFGTTCTDDDRKREIAAYFAHVTHETGRTYVFLFIHAYMLACISTISIMYVYIYNGNIVGVPRLLLFRNILLIVIGSLFITVCLYKYYIFFIIYNYCKIL